MESTPLRVKQAISAIWVTLALSALSSLCAKLSGLISAADFVGAVVVYAILCVVPYKLSNRSNATRYVYVVLLAASYLFMAAGVGSLNKLDFALSILLIPVEIWIVFRLFQPEASAWFSAGPGDC